MPKEKREAVEWIDCKEVARMLDMSPKTVHDNYVKMGLIPVMPILHQQRRMLKWVKAEVIAYQYRVMEEQRG